MKVTTQGSTHEFNPIDVVIRVESQRELDGLRELAVLNVGAGVIAKEISERDAVDAFLDELNSALIDC